MDPITGVANTRYWRQNTAYDLLTVHFQPQFKVYFLWKVWLWQRSLITMTTVI